jgi:hypothetical protein
MASETRSRRREILSQHWTADAKYVDPLTSGDGLEGVDALIADLQQRFPDFRFKLIGEPNGYGDHVRFSRGLGPHQGTRTARADHLCDSARAGAFDQRIFWLTTCADVRRRMRKSAHQ